MESNSPPLLHLGLLSQSQVTDIRDGNCEASCKFIYQANIFHHEESKISSTVQVIRDYVVEASTETGAILSGFKCDYQIQFEVMRNKTDNPRNLGTPEQIIFFFKQGDSPYEIKLKMCENISIVEQFIKVLSTKYIVKRGFKESFKPIKRIGKGVTASVFSAESLLQPEQVAIKSFRRETYFKNLGKKSFQKQFQILSMLKHQNLCELKGVYQTENSTYVIIQLLAISLFSFVKQYGFPTLIRTKAIMKGLLQGLQYVHSLGIMHRDLKLQNIMMRKIDGKLEPVIVDFGLAEFVESQEFLYTRCGTPGYVAPQILEIKGQKKKYGKDCDIFSLGVIFYILLFKKPVFEGQEIKDVIKKNIQCELNFDFPEFNKIDEDGQKLIKAMLEKDPKNRISAKQALQNPFLSQKFGNDQEYHTVGHFNEE